MFDAISISCITSVNSVFIWLQVKLKFASRKDHEKKLKYIHTV